MTQEDKELLLKDLCARLPYNVIVDYRYNAFGVHDEILVKRGSKYILNCYLLAVFTYPQLTGKGAYIKPYLFPLSSMTEEQNKEWLYTLSSDYHITFDTVDWLNQKHFDYRGLIEKGLAIDATNLNIYKTSMLNNPQITIGTKICLKSNPDEILTIISDDCHEDKFECSDGSVLSLKQIKKYYNII